MVQLKCKKAGVKTTPAFHIILYFILVFLDLLTTYLATPDLSYEGNWITRYFNLNWVQVILMNVIIVLFVTSGLLIAFYYLNKFYKGKKHFGHSYIFDIFHNRRIFISLVLICIFYSQMLYSAFLTCNNYLHYIYILNIESVFTKFSDWYIDKVIIAFPLFLFFCYLFFILVTILYTVYIVRRMERKYLKAFVQKDHYEK